MSVCECRAHSSVSNKCVCVCMCVCVCVCVCDSLRVHVHWRCDVNHTLLYAYIVRMCACTLRGVSYTHTRMHACTITQRVCACGVHERACIECVCGKFE